MYTEEALKIAAGIITKIAQENNVPEAQVRADLESAMNIARFNSFPEGQAFWATFSCAGAEPTLEEFILWAAGLTMESLYL